MGILEMLADDVVLGDGGYIVELEKRGYVIAGAFTPELALEYPGAIRELHIEFLRAGSEVLQVMAFYGSRSKLETVGQADRTFEINQKTTQIAKEVAGDKALVAGDLSATWKWEAGDNAGNAEIAGIFDEQIEAQEGVDFFIGETFWHLGEALLCLERIKAKTNLPAMITMSFRATTETDDGYSAADCARMLADAGAEIVGANCMRDPVHTYPILDEMRGATDAYIAAQPVAHRTSDEVPWFTGTSAFPDKLEPTQMTRYEMADYAVKAKAMGVNFIGACCGTVAMHVREMAKVLGKFEEEQIWQPDPDKPMSETEFNWERRQES